MALIGYMIYLVEGKADTENNPARFFASNRNGIDGSGASAGDRSWST